MIRLKEVITGIRVLLYPIPPATVHVFSNPFGDMRSKGAERAPSDQRF
jgi:hypothetical protein